MTDFMNEYCMHTATCGELRKGDVGREVVLCGWAWHNRDHGGLLFLDLRGRPGLVATARATRRWSSIPTA